MIIKSEIRKELDQYKFNKTCDRIAITTLILITIGISTMSISNKKSIPITPATGQHMSHRTGDTMRAFITSVNRPVTMTVKSVKQLGHVSLYEGFDDFGHDYKFTNEVIL